MTPRSAHALLCSLIAACFALLCACTTTVHEPASVRDPATVYILDYGRHASLLLPREDSSDLVEFAFGEWGWFAEGHDCLLRGPFVLLFPGQGTLGRKQWPPPPPGTPMAEWIGVISAEPIMVERSRAAALVARLDAAFEEHEDSRIANATGMEFVKIPRRYRGLSNSNTLVGEWLRELGAEVDGPAFFSNFAVRRERIDASQR